MSDRVCPRCNGTAVEYGYLNASGGYIEYEVSCSTCRLSLKRAQFVDHDDMTNNKIKNLHLYVHRLRENVVNLWDSMMAKTPKDI